MRHFNIARAPRPGFLLHLIVGVHNWNQSLLSTVSRCHRWGQRSPSSWATIKATRTPRSHPYQCPIFNQKETIAYPVYNNHTTYEIPSAISFKTGCQILEWRPTLISQICQNIGAMTIGNHHLWPVDITQNVINRTRPIISLMKCFWSIMSHPITPNVCSTGCRKRASAEGNPCANYFGAVCHHMLGQLQCSRAQQYPLDLGTLCLLSHPDQYYE